MPVVQTEYPNTHDALVQGQLVDPQTCDVDSMNLVGAAGVPFGYAVRRSTGASAGDRDIELGAGRKQIALLSAQAAVGDTTINNGAPTRPAMSYSIFRFRLRRLVASTIT